MSTYVIGDLQGCYEPLVRLLDQIAFDPAQDHLWFAGDIVNRGPDSLKCLQFVKQTCEAGHGKMVLGNHDFHLLAAFAGLEKYQSKSDTLTTILNHPQAAELVDWLRSQPLMVQSNQAVMVHAGVAPQWSIAQAQQYAQEIETLLQSTDWQPFIKSLFDKKGQCWHDDLTGIERHRYIVNAFVRMRYCQADGTLDFANKSAPKHPIATANADDTAPWFAFETRPAQDHEIYFGHWSTLGVMDQFHVHATDTGCLWGGQLSAYCIDQHTRTQVPCAQSAQPKKNKSQPKSHTAKRPTHARDV